jgi:hypothetical protein
VFAEVNPEDYGKGLLEWTSKRGLP